MSKKCVGAMEQAQRFGITHRKFVNYSTPLKHVFTMCLLLSKDEVVVARGLSICSVSEPFNYKSGRSKAFGRAINSLYCKDERPIIRDMVDEAWASEIVSFRFNIADNGSMYKFYEYIFPEVDKHKLEYKIYDVPKKYATVAIPREYPLKVTREFFPTKQWSRVTTELCVNDITYSDIMTLFN